MSAPQPEHDTHLLVQQERHNTLFPPYDPIATTQLYSHSLLVLPVELSQHSCGRQGVAADSHQHRRPEPLKHLLLIQGPDKGIHRGGERDIGRSKIQNTFVASYLSAAAHLSMISST